MVTIRPTNHLLAALHHDVYERISPSLELRELRLGEQLSAPGTIMPVVYFPLSGVVSLLALTEEGQSIEVMVIGSEGVVGFWMALGAVPPWQTVVQGDGEALVLALDTFMALFNSES